MKFPIDLTKVKETLEPKPIKLASVENNIEKVGFGVVRFNDNTKTGLWEIAKDENGNEYLVALYDDGEEIKKENNWKVQTDKSNKVATFYYKNTPITNLSLQELGVEASETNTFIKIASERINENKELVVKMLNELEETYKQKIISKFPELGK